MANPTEDNTTSWLAGFESKGWVLDSSKLEIGRLIGYGSNYTKVKWATLNVGSKRLPVAVKYIPKVLHPRGQPHTDAFPACTYRNAVMAEIQSMIAVRSLHTLRLFGVAETATEMLLVLEYCERGSLMDLLRTARESPAVAAALTWSARVAIAYRIALGMAMIHQRGVLHRDLKSPNILLTRDCRVIVSDFGYSRIVHFLTSHYSMSGPSNPRWLAPEIAAQVLLQPMQPGVTEAEQLMQMRWTPAADVYSYGVILWELLTMQFPFGRQKNEMLLCRLVMGEELRLLDVDISVPPYNTYGAVAEYCKLMTACLSKDPSQRPSFDAMRCTFLDIVVAARRTEQRNALQNAVSNGLWRKPEPVEDPPAASPSKVSSRKVQSVFWTGPEKKSSTAHVLSPFEGVTTTAGQAPQKVAVEAARAPAAVAGSAVEPAPPALGSILPVQSATFTTPLAQPHPVQPHSTPAQLQPGGHSRQASPTLQAAATAATAEQQTIKGADAPQTVQHADAPEFESEDAVRTPSTIAQLSPASPGSLLLEPSDTDSLPVFVTCETLQAAAGALSDSSAGHAQQPTAFAAAAGPSATSQAASPGAGLLVVKHGPPAGPSASPMDVRPEGPSANRVAFQATTSSAGGGGTGLEQRPSSVVGSGSSFERGSQEVVETGLSLERPPSLTMSLTGMVASGRSTVIGSLGATSATSMSSDHTVQMLVQLEANPMDELPNLDDTITDSALLSALDLSNLATCLPLDMRNKPKQRPTYDDGFPIMSSSSRDRSTGSIRSRQGSSCKAAEGASGKGGTRTQVTASFGRGDAAGTPPATAGGRHHPEANEGKDRRKLGIIAAQV